MSEIRIEPVRSRRDRRAFIQFPYDHYRSDQHWVPPLRMDTATLLNPKKNAFFEHGDLQTFIARNREGQILGRIAAIVNGMHLKKYDDGVGFFGFFECVDNDDVAEALFDAAESWLRQRNLVAMRGPTNPSMNDVAGMLVDGFDRPPAILMPYNKPYYAALLERAGFRRVMTMWSYYTNNRMLNHERLDRGAKIVKQRNPGLSVRKLEMDRWDDEVRTLLDIYNDAWSDNWGHVPMTDGEIRQLADEMKMIVRPDLVNIVEDEGVPIAFSVVLPDINYALAKIRNGRLFPTGLVRLVLSIKLDLIRESRMPLMGVRKAYQGRGIDAYVVADIVNRNRRVGMMGCDMSWVLDDNNRLKNFLVGIGGVKDNEYALFERAHR